MKVCYIVLLCVAFVCADPLWKYVPDEDGMLLDDIKKSDAGTAAQIMKPLGQGYCDAGYIRGWDGKGIESTEACNALCLSESDCYYAAFYKGSTCSRYNEKTCNLNDNKDHFTSKKVDATWLTYQAIGCYADNQNRAISGKRTTYSPSVAIKKCFERAQAERNEYFAVQHNNECFTSKDAGDTYNKYGQANGCKDGRGGGWKQDVYRIVSATYQAIGCYADNQNRAISGKRTTYSPSVAIKKCFERAQAEGNEYFAVQNNGECFTSRYAGSTYNKYGSATGCKDGRGGGWKQDVYRIISATWLGCFADNQNRAIEGKRTTYSPSVAFKKCFERAEAEGNVYFAVQNNNECFTNIYAGSTYNKYGSATGCKDGRGGSWKQDVYRIILGRRERRRLRMRYGWLGRK